MYLRNQNRRSILPEKVCLVPLSLLWYDFIGDPFRMEENCGWFRCTALQKCRLRDRHSAVEIHQIHAVSGLGQPSNSGIHRLFVMVLGLLVFPSSGPSRVLPLPPGFAELFEVMGSNRVSIWNKSVTDPNHLRVWANHLAVHLRVIPESFGVIGDSLFIPSYPFHYLRNSPKRFSPLNGHHLLRREVLPRLAPKEEGGHTEHGAS